MRTLAIECATEACSVALFDDRHLLANTHQVLGRGHAEHLIPMIAKLPEKGRADRILVSRGPGSFTGVRIGIAAARALALAWQAQLLGYPTLALVAAQFGQAESGPVTVCMNAGHGEWFVQNFGANLEPEDEVCSLTPDQAARQCRHPIVAGNRAVELVLLLNSDAKAIECLPNAKGARLITQDLLSDNCKPIYGRGPDAKPMT